MVEITQVRAWGYGGGEHPFSCAGGAGAGGGGRTYFLGLEEQCRLSGDGNLLARLQSAGLQEIFKWSETLRSHIVTDNEAQAL